MPRECILTILTLLIAFPLSASVVLDRVAVIVGKQVIKESDILRDLRGTEFLNRQPPDFSAQARRKAADRLVDQMIIREEIRRDAYTQAPASQVDAMMKQIRDQRAGGSDTRLQQELARYGLTEDQLRAQLQWQFDVLRFIDQRFRPAVLVTDEEVKAYYDQHRAALDRQYPQIKTYQGMEPKVRGLLEGERLNQEFDRWLDAQRKRANVEYKQGAFQ